MAKALTIGQLRDIAARAHATLSGLAFPEPEPRTLLTDLQGIVEMCELVIGESHMGHAEEELVIDLQADERCSECGEVADHAKECSYHEKCRFCGRESAEHIGERANGTPIRWCAECGVEWEHRPCATCNDYHTEDSQCPVAIGERERWEDGVAAPEVR